MKFFLFAITGILFFNIAAAQQNRTIKFRNQYKAEVKSAQVMVGTTLYKADADGNISLPMNMADSFTVKGTDHADKTFAFSEADKENTIFIHKNFTWKDLLTPMFYIIFGGVWFIVFVVFAETGLFAGFFLPGDSLLFVTGIYSNDLVSSGLGITGTGSFVNLVILGVIISLAGILGNFVGYWFGKKVAPSSSKEKTLSFLKRNICYRQKTFTKSMVAAQL